jgi:hypothetical protein
VEPLDDPPLIPETELIDFGGITEFESFTSDDVFLCLSAAFSSSPLLTDSSKLFSTRCSGFTPPRCVRAKICSEVLFDVEAAGAAWIRSTIFLAVVASLSIS